MGGIYFFIVPQLNDIYSGIEYKQQWLQEVKNQVKDLENEYLQCIAYLLKLKVINPLYRTQELNNEQDNLSNHIKSKKYVLFNEWYKLLSSRDASWLYKEKPIQQIVKNVKTKEELIQKTKSTEFKEKIKSWRLAYEKNITKNKPIFEKLKNIGVKQ